MPSDDESRIDELQKSLYSRSAPDVRTRRKLRFFEKSSDIKKSWDRKEEEPIEPVTLNEEYKEYLPMSFFSKFLVASAIFCLLSISLGAFLFFRGANLISADNIDIVINGPVSVSGGEPINFDVRVSNKNNIDLEAVDLSLEFPDGTVDPSDQNKEMRSYRELVGDIPAGKSADKKVSAIIFGEENIQKQIEVTVTYSVKGSSSVFTKTRSYDVLISSSPISMEVSSFTEVTSGQDFEFKIELKSNSSETLKNVLLRSEYPFGFTFRSSDPKPLSDNAVWKIGDIPPGGTRKVTIKGVVEGENTDIRVFHFKVGAQSSKSNDEIGTEYASIDRELAIEKPFVSVQISANNDEPEKEYAARFGESVRINVEWFNNLSVPISNMQITAKLSGTAYDRETIQPDLGTYRSSNDEIVWNQITIPELASVGAGKSGRVSFTVVPTNKNPNSNTNPFINLKVGISGNRTQESNVPETLASAAVKNIKVASAISLSGRLVRTVGPFANTGPIPPKVDQKTTYTVIWTVDNAYNAINNAQVTASLPDNVDWLGKVSPSTENVTYDNNTGVVTWDIGSVGANTAGSNRRKEVAFQVSFEPGANLVDQAPNIVEEAHLVATDEFTGVTLESMQDYITTRFSTDPTYKEGNEKVVR